MDLKAPTTGLKKKVNCFIVLIPSLAEAAQSTDMTPAQLHVAFVNQIRAMALPFASVPTTTAETPTAVVVSPTHDILKKTGSSFEGILQFL